MRKDNFVKRGNGRANSSLPGEKWPLVQESGGVAREKVLKKKDKVDDWGGVGKVGLGDCPLIWKAEETMGRSHERNRPRGDQESRESEESISRIGGWVRPPV